MHHVLNICLPVHWTLPDCSPFVLQLWAYEVLGLSSPESSYHDQHVIPRALHWGHGYRGKSVVRGQLDFFRGELDRLTSTMVRMQILNSHITITAHSIPCISTNETFVCLAGTVARVGWSPSRVTCAEQRDDAREDPAGVCVWLAMVPWRQGITLVDASSSTGSAGTSLATGSED